MSNRAVSRSCVLAFVVLGFALAGPLRAAPAPTRAAKHRYEFNDSHFHIAGNHGWIFDAGRRSASAWEAAQLRKQGK